MDTEQHSFFAAAFLAGLMMNFCLTVIFLGLTPADHFVEFKEQN